MYFFLDKILRFIFVAYIFLHRKGQYGGNEPFFKSNPPAHHKDGIKLFERRQLANSKCMHIE